MWLTRKLSVMSQCYRCSAGIVK